MAYQALYRKYRPKTFSDVVGQEHITETLKNELATGKIVHAYLFTGTRGTGKTSCAKILAKAVNCLSPDRGDPCLTCDACLSVESGENTDILEIDAASNNGVDNIRELRERVNFTPANSKFRIYIIDEVHMLSPGAFNALLKTLEEPPAHVIFVLATTEVHKLPATILSRCQRFDFKRIDPVVIADRIRYVAKEEGLTITDGAANLIAAAADGGMRDALSMLDLCASGNSEIDETTVETVCGMAGSDYLFRLTDAIKQGNTEAALLLIDQLYNTSVDMQKLLTDLIAHYRDLMILKTVRSGNRPIVSSETRLALLEKQAADYELKDIMTVLNALQSAAGAMQNGNRRCEMEMTVIRLCTPSLSTDIASLEKRISALENGALKPAAKTAKPVVSKPEPKPEPETEEEIVTEEEIEETVSDSAVQPGETPESGETPVAQWSEIVRVLTKTCPLIAGVLNESAAYIKGEYLLIDAPNDQFRTMIKNGDTNYRDKIRNAAQEVLGSTYKLGPYRKPAGAKQTAQDPLAALAERLKQIEKD